MFYTNKNLKVIEKDLEWGKLRFIQLGEYGRGRKPVNITVPETIGDIEKGCHPFSIGLSKTGRPKLIDVNGNKTYVAIDTMGSYGRGCYGHIRILKSQKNLVKVLGYGWGAFGDAGRLGTADAAVLECEPGVIIRFNPTRANSEMIQVVKDDNASGSVIHFDNQDIDDAIDNDVLQLDPDWKKMEWVEISELVREQDVTNSIKTRIP